MKPVPIVPLYQIAIVALHSYVAHSYTMCILHFPFGFVAPASVSVQEKSAHSIKVSWTLAPTASSVNVTYYINASSPTYQTVRRSVTDPDREVVLSGLHPFDEYYITVQAGNPGGLSESTGTNVTTLTAGEHTLSLLKFDCGTLSLPPRPNSSERKMGM